MQARRAGVSSREATELPYRIRDIAMDVGLLIVACDRFHSTGRDGARRASRGYCVSAERFDGGRCGADRLFSRSLLTECIQRLAWRQGMNSPLGAPMN